MGDFEFIPSAEGYDDTFDYSPYLHNKYSTDPKAWAMELLEIPVVWQDMREQLLLLLKTYFWNVDRERQVDQMCAEYTTYLELVAQGATSLSLRERDKPMQNTDSTEIDFFKCVPWYEIILRDSEFLWQFTWRTMTTRKSLVWIQFMMEYLLRHAIHPLILAGDVEKIDAFIASRNIGPDFINAHLVQEVIRSTNAASYRVRPESAAKTIRLFEYFLARPGSDVNYGAGLLYVITEEHDGPRGDRVTLFSMAKIILPRANADAIQKALHIATGKMLELLLADSRADVDFMNSFLIRKFLKNGNREDLETILKHPQVNVDKNDFLYVVAKEYSNRVRNGNENRDRLLCMAQTILPRTDADGIRKALHIATQEMLELLVKDSIVDEDFINSFLIRKFLKDRFDKQDLETILKHPQVNVNFPFGRDGTAASDQTPPVFGIHQDYANSHRAFDSYKIFLEDERVLLSLRCISGDVEFGIKDRQGHPIDQDVESLIHSAEVKRLQWAKERVRFLRDWKVEPYEITIDDDVLSTYVLPYIADIVSPIETLGGYSLNFEFPAAVEIGNDHLSSAYEREILESSYIRMKHSSDLRIWASEMLQMPYVWKDVRASNREKWQEYKAFLVRVSGGETNLRLNFGSEFESAVESDDDDMTEEDSIGIGMFMTTKFSLFAITAVIQGSHEDIMRKFIDGGALDKFQSFIDTRNISSDDINFCCLHAALESKQSEILRYLLTLPGIDVNFSLKEFHECTLLRRAVRMHCSAKPEHKDTIVSMAKILLEHPDIDANKDSPIELATGRMLELLLDDSRIDRYLDFDTPDTLKILVEHPRTSFEPEDCSRLIQKFLENEEIQHLHIILKHPTMRSYVDEKKFDFNYPTDQWGSPLLFGIHKDDITKNGPSYFYKFLLENEQVTLAFRNYYGNNVLDIHWYLYGYGTPDRLAISDKVRRVLYEAELLRLEWAKKKMIVMKHWSVGPHGATIDENVLSTHLLPYVADVLTPVADLENGWSEVWNYNR